VSTAGRSGFSRDAPEKSNASRLIGMPPRRSYTDQQIALKPRFKYGEAYTAINKAANDLKTALYSTMV
jgi:hypothetical protein